MYCSDVPSYYFKFICGKKNETRARIEKETKTQLKIPRPGQEGDIGNFCLFFIPNFQLLLCSILFQGAVVAFYHFGGR